MWERGRGIERLETVHYLCFFLASVSFKSYCCCRWYPYCHADCLCTTQPVYYTRPGQLGIQRVPLPGYSYSAQLDSVPNCIPGCRSQLPLNCGHQSRIKEYTGGYSVPAWEINSTAYAKSKQSTHLLCSPPGLKIDPGWTCVLARLHAL